TTASRRCALHVSRGGPSGPPTVAVSLQPAPAKETAMKELLLCGITLIGSSVAFAQPPAPPETSAPPRTITLTGCVGGGGAGAQPVTLTSAMIIPTTEQAGAVTPSPVPGAVSPTPTQPAAPAAAAGPVGTP